ncbi:putative terminase small subunit [Erwinia phage PEp14]|uniref:Putative terminase small subunit n=1 Tax=Erwinia phage PEp14 TaxID=1131315 RepID=H2DE31_9CAUD|nr:terminase small subunit [Erwinia phage PEp14]AEY69591.1 putative terminase small subunit [Erwinia phage PEp14]
MPTKKPPTQAKKNRAPSKRSRTTPNKEALTSDQQNFVDELLMDEHMIGWRAYQRAYKCSNRRSCEQSASRLLSLVKVQEAIKKGMAARSERIQYGQDELLRRLVHIATADPNEIVHYRRDCCRHCHGIEHQYQWRDENEFAEALLKASERDDDDDGPQRPLPTNDGGYGFNPKREPHPECPNCDGDGYGHMHVEDTRFLSGPARMLYAGMEMTKEGIKPKMHDQMAAAQMVARHLGMFNDKLTLKGDKENPLVALLESLPGATLKPVDD